MHSSENNRRSQRRRPDLNINTSSAPTRSRESMPSTPPARAKTKPPVSSRAYRVAQTVSTISHDSEESFLDNGSDENRPPEPTFPEVHRGRHPRDSHDLSFPARQITRDSLVTNMLTSLDQFSLGQISTPTRSMFDDDDPLSPPRGDGYSKSMTNASRPSRMWSSGNGHGHGHGYTYSSDFEGADDASSRLSGQFSRGRRSDSGSGFQPSLGPINSLRDRSHPGTAPGGRALHSRAGRTSKTNSTNSIDAGGYAQVLNTQRWAHGIGGRSSSFDDAERPPMNSPNAWKSEFSNTFLVDDYEAAPTPTIPAGPRRPNMPPAPLAPPPIPQSEPEPALERKKSAARSRSGTMRTTQSKYAPSHEAPPPLPPVDLDSAPAPHVGYGKSKELSNGNPAPTPQTKQGFFSRIFGYRNSPNAAENRQSQMPPAPAETAESSGNRAQQVASQAKTQFAPPSRDSQRSSQQPHVVQKKSSFFRRRKRSIAEPLPPPPPMPPPVDNSRVRESLPVRDVSPASSLREIMGPYLHSGTTPVPGGVLSSVQDNSPRARGYESQDEENPRRMRGFSPDYEPSPNATIRTVKSTSALRSQESTRRRTDMEMSMRDLPELPKRDIEGRDATFFHDSSDEGEKQWSAEEQNKQRRQSRQSRQNRQSSRPSPQINTPKDETGAFDIREQQAPRPEDISKPESSPNLLLQSNADEDTHQGARKSSTFPGSANKSANSLPSLQVDNSEITPKLTGSPLDEPEVSVGEPTEDDRQKAQKIFDGNEDFICKEKAAAWMGEEGPVRQRTLRAYIELYDFANQSVLAALRQICGRLVFRAETQQVDRILVAFSSRWCDCNPNHGFKATDVIHTMCYSIMLLNTDLHLADIDQKMTRSQFVKNTMTTIKQALADVAPESFDRASILPGKQGLLSPIESEFSMQLEPESEKPGWRSSFKPLPRSESSMGNYADGQVDACGPLVKAPFEGSMKAWTQQMEVVLKDIYTSIRDERLPLFGAEPTQPPPSHSQGSLSVMGMLKRSPSVLSKAPSEGHVSVRGRINDQTRNPGSRWNSKSRSRPRLPGNGMSSSRTSFEDGNSIWSPAASSAAWSRYSLGRTQTSMSIDSFGTYAHGDYQQSIGFANALSQAIIREDVPPGTSGQSIMSEEVPTTQLLEDESLELAGPPWVKEGIVIHKHHLDGVDKKARERNWTEVFAVVQKGTMSLFSFSSKSMRSKGRVGRKHAPGAVVGGGNWQENATSVGSFSLRQTLASVLPAPGYSRTRPHVWALSLPSGAVHLFQVGTEDISKEFALAVNYWSARLSTHPLVGGVSNIEYGWSDAIINEALITPVIEPSAPPRPGSAAAGRTSMHSRQGSLQSSIRSSFDMGGASRTKLPGDRVHIAEWTPPTQSLRPSNCSEAEQLETLDTYVKSVEEDLKKHNQLRSPMLLAFTPRGHNAGKAMTNWERKSSYLLHEIVKFRTYVDSLQHAKTRQAEVYAERDSDRRAILEDLADDASAHTPGADAAVEAS
ncbi:hypothetical protein GGR52DRAFT_585403 [Hypoxylon sp. FL1284]|nr:hypothetical protein GGR52DRAFT_585403 [Hypoxylon sp. FL1284]